MVQVVCLGVRALFLFFVLPSAFCSFLLPPYAHQLPGLGWMVSPSVPIRFFFVFSFLSLFLALLRAVEERDETLLDIKNNMVDSSPVS